jgi:hypothetical protein
VILDPRVFVALILAYTSILTSAGIYAVKLTGRPYMGFWLAITWGLIMITIIVPLRLLELSREEQRLRRRQSSAPLLFYIFFYKLSLEASMPVLLRLIYEDVHEEEIPKKIGPRHLLIPTINTPEQVTTLLVTTHLDPKLDEYDWNGVPCVVLRWEVVRCWFVH